MRALTKTEVKEVKYTVYVASDGTEFDTCVECERYERKLSLKGIEVVETAIPCSDFEGEHYAMLYNVKNEEDWKILIERVWCHHQYNISEEFPGPDVYYVIIYPNGDYPDEYEVHKAEEYLKNFYHYTHDFMDEMRANIARLYLDDESNI